MNKEFQRKIYLPVFIIFIIINTFCIVFGNFLDAHKIDHLVLIVSNAVLFAITFISLVILQKTMQHSNPNVFFRAAMSSTIIKLLVIACGVFAYLFFAKENRSIGAVICTMLLYAVYTVAEVRNALTINRMGNGKS